MTHLALITGLSGSGKTLALRSLEDLGYFSVDNLPVSLIGPFVDLLDRGGEEPRGALVVDARERSLLHELPELVEGLRAREDVKLFVVFLEARDDILIRRYKESRRPHPVSASAGSASVEDAIQHERSLLAPLRALADRVIQSDELSPHDLRRKIREGLSAEEGSGAIRVEVVSFGFKYGMPRDADMVFDVRFVENPYFRADLRSLTGRDEGILEFLRGREEWVGFIERTEEMLGFVMPHFVHEGKSYLTVAVGCTGGRHRSVAAAEHFGRFLESKGYATSVTHRDLERKAKQEQG